MKSNMLYISKKVKVIIELLNIDYSNKSILFIITPYKTIAS
jgi:hypothetical protein